MGGPMSPRMEKVPPETTFVAGNQRKASVSTALTKAANVSRSQMSSILWETGKILLADILAYHALPRRERNQKVKKSLRERGLAKRLLGISGDKLDRILRAARGEGPSEASKDDSDEDNEKGGKEGAAENGAENSAENEVMGDGDEIRDDKKKE
ncbi:hypothetical protein MMC07_009817 [Pseudocyphellaria aurata]|nr:hypothetical protein [Pseudocyphellaria aurata]